MISVIKKDLILFFNDKKALALSLLLPIALITLFVFAFGGLNKRSDMPPLKMGLYANDTTEETVKNMITQLYQLNTLEIIRADSATLIQKIKKGNIAGVLILANRDNAHLFIEDALQKNESSIIKSIISPIIFKSSGAKKMRSEINKALEKEFGLDVNDSSFISIQGKIEKNLEAGLNNTNHTILQTQVINTTEGINTQLVHAVAGTVIMCLLFSLTGMAASLLEEKEKGTLRRLMLRPGGINNIFFAKYFASVIIGCFQLIVLFLFANLTFSLPLYNHLLQLSITGIAIALCCASFALFIASFCYTRKQVESVSTLIVLIMSALGGSMMPTFIMPELMQKMSVFTVNYWGVQSFYDIYLREHSWSLYLQKIVVLLTIATILLIISRYWVRKNIFKII
jgi:ABC-type multidrug transport system permease subunit